MFEGVTCYSCNMCTSDLTMYAWAAGPHAQGLVHTCQSNQECTCNSCYVTLSLP